MVKLFTAHQYLLNVIIYKWFNPMYMAQTANIWDNNLLKIKLELKLLLKA